MLRRFRCFQLFLSIANAIALISLSSCGYVASFSIIKEFCVRLILLWLAIAIYRTDAGRSSSRLRNDFVTLDFISDTT